MPLSSSTTLFGFFEKMSIIRAFEETIAEAYRDGRLPGLLHLCMGSEATSVGVISSLLATDRVYSSHRPHGHFLAAGTDPRALMAELAGKASGICRGRAGSMHLMDTRAIMATGVVGGTLPIALGHSLFLKNDSVSVVFFGDGAVQTGTFHETMNMAALWKARILFICENNGKIEFSSREEHTSVSDITSYGRLYGINALEVDGCNVSDVADVTNKLLQNVRSGDGPALLVSTISRLRPHYEGDLRRQEDLTDPLEVVIADLTRGGHDERSLRELHESNLASYKSMLESVLEYDDSANPSEDTSLVYSREIS